MTAGKEGGAGREIRTKRRLALAALVAATLPFAGAAAAPDTGHGPHAVPDLPLPGWRRPFRDPVFGATVMRITDPAQWPGQKRIRHYYSKSQPFNADGTRAIFFAGDGTILLYDTADWKPLQALRIVSGDPEIQWHPTDPAVFYYLDFVGRSPNVRAMFRYDLRDGTRTLMHDFAEYDTARGRFEGNMDAGGRYYAMVGWKGKSLEALVYDVANDRVRARIPVTEAMVDDWISVSPGGRYVVMMGKERSRVYDIDLHHLRDLAPGSFGHGDLCRLADGREALVYDGADRQLDANRNINIAPLDGGPERVGVRIGWGSTPHVSCRNLDLPGWALVSTQGPDDKYPNHDFEVFWLRLDGSGEVRRLAHHHSRRRDGGYFAEPHAVASRDGKRVIFASNWGGSPTSDYLVEAAAPPGGASLPASR